MKKLTGVVSIDKVALPFFTTQGPSTRPLFNLAARSSAESNAPVITQPDGSQAPDKTFYTIEKRIVTSDDTLEISMAARLWCSNR